MLLTTFHSQINYPVIWGRQTLHHQSERNNASFLFFSFFKYKSDLERISGSLEAHKSDYTFVSSLQAENVKLKEEVLQLRQDNQTLQNEVETLKLNHTDKLRAIEAANEEKCMEFFYIPYSIELGFFIESLQKFLFFAFSREDYLKLVLT